MRFLKYTVLTLIVLFALAGAAVVGLYYYVKDDLPSVETLRDVRLQIPMQVYSADGRLISQFGEQRRIPLTLDEIPQPMIDAILATEDSRFYEHRGVDPIGVMRAFRVLVVTGEIREGASTITMQLARNFFLSRERVWMRKVKEAFIAVHIEQKLSKDEILELYLNKLALGHRAYGVGAAAQVYYGRELHELTLAEIATIAGLPQGPSILNPISNPQASVQRRRIVLRRMLDEGYISRAEYDAAFNAPVTARYHGAEIEVNAPFLAEMVRQETVDRFGLEAAYTAGLRVYTTVKSEHQLAAEFALQENLHAYDERHGYRGPQQQLWGFDPERFFRAEEDTRRPLPDEATLETMLRHGGARWTDQEIIQYVNRQPRFGRLQHAVVVGVHEQSVDIILRGGMQHTLEWDRLDWARQYIDNERQGRAPQRAADILNEGDHILVRPFDDGWKLAQVPGPSSAIVALHPQTGAIQSIVGGYSFSLSQFNRATQAKRQVGSTIKPFIYAAAFEHDFTLASLVNDAPITQWNPGSGVAWRPRNSPDVYDGPIRLREALARSKNVVSVRLIRDVGVDRTADYLARFGFAPHEIPRNESLSLGSASFTPLELARAFAVFANGGHLVDPYFIDRIEDQDGNIIYQANPRYACARCAESEYRETHAIDPETPLQQEFHQAPQVISEQTAFLITEALQSAIWGGGSWAHQTGWNGTGWRAQSLRNRNIAGKTGTTNDVRDTWFAGYSQGTVSAVWVGFDNLEFALGRTSLNANLGRQRQPIVGSEAGGTTALPGWILYMERVIGDVDTSPYELPSGMMSVRIDQPTGKLTNRSDHTSMFEYFVRGTEPKEFADSDGRRPQLFEDDDGLFR
ncbi:penicillin-binding protein 1A [Aliidiomarina halalkaliphila]|uniref:Penicillin-binding protein 1A n=1 Tax=Aliidiomarina halalkaliphila TaxID=2593535 RepID=A0A552X0X1_9GAMM|nr:penicillin-binding protein 1A [Aliidiomarina halalkaliphila]